MKHGEAIRTIMKKKGLGVTKLGKRIGRPPSTVANRMAMNTISVAKLNELLRVMDYKIIIMPSDVRTPDDGLEVE